MEKRKRGQPRSFSNGKELVELYRQFCDEIKDNGYNTVPYITEFDRWIAGKAKNADRHTIYLTIHKYYPEIKSQIEQIQSETMSQGAMLGKYKETSTIFALKCKCGWRENHEENKGNNDKQDELVKAIKNAIR